MRVLIAVCRSLWNPDTKGITAVSTALTFSRFAGIGTSDKEKWRMANNADGTYMRTDREGYWMWTDAQGRRRWRKLNGTLQGRRKPPPQNWCALNRRKSWASRRLAEDTFDEVAPRFQAYQNESRNSQR